MTLEELNKHYVKTTYLDQAIKLAKEQRYLTLETLEQHFKLNRQYVKWLWDMVEQELKDVELTDFLSSEAVG